MIDKWHDLLSMPKHNKAWHRQDLEDELDEYHEARGLFYKWSELSDIVYTCTRGRWSGHTLTFPLGKWQFALGVTYMIPKYSLRWLFFRRAAIKLNPNLKIKEVRNPKKIHKLHDIAKKYNLSPEDFQSACEKQLKYWPLLP